MRFLGRIGVRFARRSRWLAQRLWLVAAAEIALITRSHWRRLEPEERRRLIELARKSRGRPSRLSTRERREAAELLEKVNYAQLGGNGPHLGMRAVPVESPPDPLPQIHSRLPAEPLANLG